MITRKYNLINNLTGWGVFIIALITYWLTLEPTASYWDCGEFIIQADKLEVGHPPGNPIFMLTARFFANFAPDSASISVAVNAMSGLLSALTILLLFWTVTHLVRRLIVKDNETGELSLTQYLLIMGAGVVGALAYCWSDTFWFSAVEGEVYAFSSFCTALVFWLILKWENRADNPSSDKYLILIAYVIGVSIAVHLLNLLCIPAIVLIFAYRKFKNMNLKKSLLVLFVSFVIVALVLFGLVPGFIKMAQEFELMFVNGFGMSFNSGALAYAIIAALIFVWAIYEIRSQRSERMMKIAVLATVLISGMLFFGNGWWIGIVLMALLAVFMFTKYSAWMSVRVMNVLVWSIAVIFVGYSSYALILIRSSADTPMNQNSPDNVFDLASYLNREQYGETPLLYGPTLYSSAQRELVSSTTDTIPVDNEGHTVTLTTPQYTSTVNKGAVKYSKGVKGAEVMNDGGFMTEGELAHNKALEARGGDYYVKSGYGLDQVYNPELNMLFPRIYSPSHREYYKTWVNLDTTQSNIKPIYAIDQATGEKVPEFDIYAQPYYNEATGLVSYPQRMGYRPTMAQNLSYFFNYQLIHMYMRYFMWNFAGRQNDVMNMQGELDAGNWISGIPFIDNARLGDQSLLPDDLGKNNAGHNVFYMLPLILGLIGLVWQAFAGQRGVEQFWVVFFLFFMTGIAIVLYLNQPPMQPRERDYAYAGSFYAFAIWIGMGVVGLWKILMYLLGKKSKPLYAAVAAVVAGIAVPLQMVSQTWDDHDRSGRYAARDFAINYLESLEPNAIVFCNGDNDTFPLWYAQEVEGVRPDVKIVNLSYLASDWYANQMRKQTYQAAPIKFTARPEDIAYSRNSVVLLGREKSPADLLTVLKDLYKNPKYDEQYSAYPTLPTSVVTIPVDKEAVLKRGLVTAADTARLVNEIAIDLGSLPEVRGRGYITLGELLMLDIIATNAADGWPRPIYWCMSVGDEYHLGLTKYMRNVGMVHQLVPTIQEGLPTRADRALGVIGKYRWGGADAAKVPYYDETARRMLMTTRSSMLYLCEELLAEAMQLDADGDKAAAKKKCEEAVKVAETMEKNLPSRVAPFGMSIGMTLPDLYITAGKLTGNNAWVNRGLKLLEEQMGKWAQYLRYNASVSRFGNVSLTPESRMMPYQYYIFIEKYINNGGDVKVVDKILSTTGFTRDQLKKNYDMAYGGGAGDELSDESILSEAADVAEAVNYMASLSAEEYAALSDNYREVDSAYWQLYEEYAKKLGDSLMMTNPEIKKVDMNRSKRLNDEYKKTHPEGFKF